MKDPAQCRNISFIESKPDHPQFRKASTVIAYLKKQRWTQSIATGYLHMPRAEVKKFVEYENTIRCKDTPRITLKEAMEHQKAELKRLSEICPKCGRGP